MKLRGWCCLLALFTPVLRAQDFIDRLDERLTRSFCDDALRLRLSGRADLEAYRFTEPAPGLLDVDGDSLFTSRLSLYLDVQWGPRVYGFAQARADQGFDPTDGEARVRLDEYAVRVTPWDDGRLSLQAGQFASIVGRWIARHDAWENPFVNAPLAYEHVLPIRDNAAPGSAADFGEIEEGERYEYNPIVWGPSYATGASAAGRLGSFTYALEIKNAGLSSRPEEWPIDQGSFEHPHRAARLGWQPSAMWDFGCSAAQGPYFRSEAASSMPVGHSIYDYDARLLAQDISFAWHHLQIWAEVFEVRFDVPRVGEADVVSYFIETKYKITPQLFGALRWNQQLYGDVPNGEGGESAWAPAVLRTDAALGYRFTPHTQLKLQYSVQHERDQERDLAHLVAAQCSLRF